MKKIILQTLEVAAYLLGAAIITIAILLTIHIFKIY